MKQKTLPTKILIPDFVKTIPALRHVLVFIFIPGGNARTLILEMLDIISTTCTYV